LGEDVEDYERVSVRDLLKSAYIPKESAEVIQRAIEKAEKEKTITNKNRWQILEYWAADYLGGN
jgi:hypothetical protein